MSQANKKLLQDVSGELVDPEKIDYRYLLNYENKSVLLSIAKIAGINNISDYSKEKLINHLSFEIPKVLPNLVNKLSIRDHLACEIVVSAGGSMPLWEIKPKVSIESRRQKISEEQLNEKQSEKMDGIKTNKTLGLNTHLGLTMRTMRTMRIITTRK